ncbi:hypothetical protein SNEBB_001141 [Seison nebaliae]|nr:hypothetical protein SNEBB_001141 [Seison nebaliae]
MISRIFNYIVTNYNEINAATLTGALDVIVIRRPDGTFTCSPFHVRFGKLSLIKCKEKEVDIFINNQLSNLKMTLGERGEAFFVETSEKKINNMETENEIINIEEKNNDNNGDMIDDMDDGPDDIRFVLKGKITRSASDSSLLKKQENESNSPNHQQQQQQENLGKNNNNNNEKKESDEESYGNISTKRKQIIETIKENIRRPISSDTLRKENDGREQFVSLNEKNRIHLKKIIDRRLMTFNRKHPRKRTRFDSAFPSNCLKGMRYQSINDTNEQMIMKELLGNTNNNSKNIPSPGKKRFKSAEDIQRRSSQEFLIENFLLNNSVAKKNTLRPRSYSVDIIDLNKFNEITFDNDFEWSWGELPHPLHTSSLEKNLKKRIKKNNLNNNMNLNNNNNEDDEIERNSRKEDNLKVDVDDLTGEICSDDNSSKLTTTNSTSTTTTSKRKQLFDILYSILSLNRTSSLMKRNSYREKLDEENEAYLVDALASNNLLMQFITDEQRKELEDLKEDKLVDENKNLNVIKEEFFRDDRDSDIESGTGTLSPIHDYLSDQYAPGNVNVSRAKKPRRYCLSASSSRTYQPENQSSISMIGKKTIIENFRTSEKIKNLNKNLKIFEKEKNHNSFSSTTSSSSDSDDEASEKETVNNDNVENERNKKIKLTEKKLRKYFDRHEKISSEYENKLLTYESWTKDIEQNFAEVLKRSPTTTNQNANQVPSNNSFISDLMMPKCLLWNNDLIISHNGYMMPLEIASYVIMTETIFKKSLPRALINDMLEYYCKMKQKPNQEDGGGIWSYLLFRRNRQTTTKKSRKKKPISDATSREKNGELEQKMPLLKTKSETKLLSEKDKTKYFENSNIMSTTSDLNTTASRSNNNNNISKLSTKQNEHIEKNNNEEEFRTIRLTSDQIRELNLKNGSNEILFRVVTALQGTSECICNLYLWNYDDKIVISDIDGTITRSDVMGQIFPLVGISSWVQPDIAALFRSIKRNGYQFLYLSSRAIGQAKSTRDYLASIRQNGKTLPDGPLLMSPASLIRAFHQEVIERKPEAFKISCLQDIKQLFPIECKPFFAGYGNKLSDVCSYKAVGVPESRIYTINHNGQIFQDNHIVTLSYGKLIEHVEHLFPPLKVSNIGMKSLPFAFSENYSQFTFWRMSTDMLNEENDSNIISKQKTSNSIDTKN